MSSCCWSVAVRPGPTRPGPVRSISPRPVSVSLTWSEYGGSVAVQPGSLVSVLPGPAAEARVRVGDDVTVASCPVPSRRVASRPVSSRSSSSIESQASRPCSAARCTSPTPLGRPALTDRRDATARRHDEPPRPTQQSRFDEIPLTETSSSTNLAAVPIYEISYDHLTIMPKLRSTSDGRLIYKTSHKGRKAFLRHDSLAS